MSDFDKDLQDLLSAARNAMQVLRRDAEQWEVLGEDSTAEREAVRRLNMAIQLVEYDLHGQQQQDPPWDWRQ